MRRTQLATAALGLGIVLVLDVLRVWLPSIITIFGQAAATPAELLGAFALLWFLLAFAAPPLIRLVGSRPVAHVAALVLVGCRIALAAVPGGQIQLYTASVGLLAGLIWLTAVAAATARPVPGLVLGLALAAITHTALDTYDLTWRGRIWSFALIVATAALFIAAHWAASYRPGTGPSTSCGPLPASAGRASWLLFGPVLLLSGMVAGSPAVVNVALSYTPGFGRDPRPGIAEPPAAGDLASGLVTAAAVALFVGTGLARPPRRRWRWLAPVSLVAGAAAFATAWPGGLIPAVLLIAAGLGGCLSLTTASSHPSGQPGHEGVDAVPATPAAVARGVAAVTGMLLFAVLSILYYAAYDIGYPNQWVPVVAAVLVALAAVRAATRAPVATPDVDGRSGFRRTWRVPVVAGLATVLAAVAVPQDAAPVADTSSGGRLRVVAYNIRMGFGLDGRFDLDGLVQVIAGQEPDVVALSEVDRAWLLNGGHDTLALLAKRLDMRYLFAPAADPVWGDALLTRMPVRHARTVKLSAAGAPTGAQALAAVLDTGGREVVVVSTHLQPPPGAEPVMQAREVVRFATTVADGRPLVVAGDLNTEPDAAAFQVFIEAGLTDALAGGRPLPTSPADRPRKQIDHILVSPDITASDVAAPRSIASDHLPVAVTLTLDGTGRR